MPAMIVACGRLLTWYSNVQRTNMTYRMILENWEEGVAVLRCLQDTFSIRNISSKQWVAHVLKEDPVESESEGSGGDDNDTKPPKRPWTFLKAHGMAAHVWSTPLMYGDMQKVSAHIENMHVPLKDTAVRSNGQAGWELQTMTRNMRESELALKTWTPPHTHWRQMGPRMVTWWPPYSTCVPWEQRPVRRVQVWHLLSQLAVRA